MVLDVPIQIATGADNRVSVRVYSPNDDAHRVMMKLENIVDPGDRTKNEYLELAKNFTGKGWHELTFDFSELEVEIKHIQMIKILGTVMVHLKD